MEVVTEQFAELAAAVVRAAQLPDSASVVIPGNPEYVSREELVVLADDALEAIVNNLTQGS